MNGLALRELMLAWFVWTALGGVTAAVLCWRRPRSVTLAAFITAAGGAVLALRLIRGWSLLGPGAVPVTASTLWLPLAGAGLRTGLSLDGLGAVFVLVPALLAALLFGEAARRRDGETPPSSAIAGSLLAVAAAGGVALADDLLTMLAFWLLGGTLQAYLVSVGRSRRAAPAVAREVLLIEAVGSLGLGLAALYGYLASGSLDPVRIVAAVRGGAVSELELAALASGLVLAALCRASLVPLHAWLPRAAGVRPPAATLWLTGLHGLGAVLLVVRLQPLLPGPIATEGVWLAGIAAVLLGLIALNETAPERLLAAVAAIQLAIMTTGGLVGTGGAAVRLAVTQVPALVLVALCLAARGAPRSSRAARGVFPASLAVGLAALAAVPGTAGFDAWREILTVLRDTGRQGPAVLLTVASWASTAALVRHATRPGVRAAMPAPGVTVYLVLVVWVLGAAAALARWLPEIAGAGSAGSPSTESLVLVAAAAVLGAVLGLSGRRVPLAAAWPWPTSWRGLKAWSRQIAAGPGPLTKFTAGVARRLAGLLLGFDRVVLAGILEGVGWGCRAVARGCALADRRILTGVADRLAAWLVGR